MISKINSDSPDAIVPVAPLIAMAHGIRFSFSFAMRLRPCGKRCPIKMQGIAGIKKAIRSLEKRESPTSSVLA